MASRNHGLSRKAKSVPSKSTPRSSAARRAASERGQERADAGGGGRAQPLEDVEEELHGRIACRRDDCRRRGRGPSGERAGGERPRARVSARDLERYAGLFASRTRGHEVVGDARPDGDHRAPGGHLARRRPARHVDVPGRDARGADGARRRRLVRRARCSTAPTEGMAAVARGASPGDGRRGHATSTPSDMLVTTGGQQVIDLVCKTLHRPRRRRRRRGADLPRRGADASAPTRPTSCRSRWTTTACASTSSRRRSTASSARAGGRSSSTRSRPSRTRRGVTLSLPRRRRLVEVARERELLVLEDNPYGLLRYEGERAADAALARRRRLRHLPGHVLEDPLARASAWAGRSAPRPVLEKLNLGKQARRPVPVVARRSSSSAPTSPRATGEDYVADAARPLPRAGATRCSTRSPSTCRREATWTQPGGRAVHLGDAARLHRHDRPAGARAARNVAFVPGPRARTSTAAAARRCG